MDTQSGKQSIDPLQRCDLCEQKMNPTVKIYTNNTRLCKSCFDHMENLPEVVAKNVERFLIGNVV
jgi:formylmethanofuran dehydrogenase subunit E